MNKLLVCTDGSDYARVACQYAAWLAQKLDAGVEALYVSSLWDFELPFLLDLGGSLGASPYQGMTVQLEQMEREKARLVQQAVQRTLEDAGMAIRPDAFHHETGLLVDCLDLFETEDDAAGLIVLGKRGESAEQAPDHLGANLERVVRASRKPCLVTNREFRPIQKACLAYDGGPSTTEALDWIISQPALHSLDWSVVTVDDGHGEGQRTRARHHAEQRLREGGMKGDCQLLTGDVENEIERFTRDHGIDWLVMGAYGHSRVRELIIGSTTTDLLRRCHLPVLLFR